MKVKVFILFFLLTGSLLMGESLQKIKRQVKTIPDNAGIWSEWDVLEKQITMARAHKHATKRNERFSFEDDYVFDKIILVEEHFADIKGRDYVYMIYGKSKSTGAVVMAVEIDAKDGDFASGTLIDPEANAYVMSKEDAIACFKQFDINKRYTIVNVKAIYFPTLGSQHYFDFWWTMIVTDSKRANKKDVFLIHPIVDLNKGRNFLTNLAPVYLDRKSRIYKPKGANYVDRIENFFTKYKYGPKSRYDENDFLINYTPIKWEAVETK